MGHDEQLRETREKQNVRCENCPEQDVQERSFKLASFFPVAPTALLPKGTLSKKRPRICWCQSGALESVESSKHDVAKPCLIAMTFRQGISVTRLR